MSVLSGAQLNMTRFPTSSRPGQSRPPAMQQLIRLPPGPHLSSCDTLAKLMKEQGGKLKVLDLLSANSFIYLIQRHGCAPI